MKKVAMIGPGTTSKGGIATVIANFEKTFSKDTVKIHYIASWREGNSIFRMLVLMKALFQFCMLLLAKKSILRTSILLRKEASIEKFYS